MLEAESGAEGTYQRRRFMNSKPAKVIAVTSGKGGVGKTHTTVNLGLALVKAGKRVLLLDADLGLANINVLLGFKPGATLQQVLAGEKAIHDIIVNDPSGLDILPASSGIPEMTNLSEQERLLLVSALEDLGAEYDFMLVDTAAGIGDNVMYFNHAAEEIIVVINNEPTTITDAYALMKVMASRYGRRQFQVLVNRTDANSDGRATYAQLAAATDKFLSVSLKYLGSVTEDDSVSSAVIAQRPFLDMFPSSRASLDIGKIAKKVIEEEDNRAPQGGMQFFFKALVEHTD